MFELIAFDADDTLWTNEALYLMGRERFEQLLQKYGIESVSEDEVNAVEVQNLPHYGYGVMSFILSLIETAIQLTGGRIEAADIQQLLDLGKEMLSAEVEVFEYVEEVLTNLGEKYPLMLITKGDLNHQRSKVVRSGLAEYFQMIEVVSEKNLRVYQEVFTRHGYDPTKVVMVGNSLRSDILPVLELGGWAVYVPHELTWSHEHAAAPSPLNGRFFEIDHIGELPDLCKRIELEAD